jgi:hypothetical protein
LPRFGVIPGHEEKLRHGDMAMKKETRGNGDGVTKKKNETGIGRDRETRD